MWSMRRDASSTSWEDMNDRIEKCAFVALIHPGANVTDLPLEIFGGGVTGGQASTDFNGDGRTDFVDFYLFADAYGSTNAKFDLDGNGTVDFADFFRFVDAFDA